MQEPKTLLYKRSHFSTRLPESFLYSPSHFWLSHQGDDLWRVGLTKFATRMLGEMVEIGFETALDAPVSCGQIIGWIEGFKALSDVYCIAEGNFRGTNPALNEKVQLINKDPYAAGWVYAVGGKPDSRCVDVHQYKEILDATIDRLLKKQPVDEDS